MPGATPLEGIRLLDLGRYQAGPRCALMFARMGAEVIKVEGLQGDESRGNGPIVNGQSAYWVQYNSGKKSLAVDLRNERGKNILRDLVKVSDLFLQNFRPGTIDRMGFGYETLHDLNRKIIMINVSAYGQTGSHRDRIGFDPIGQAFGGMMSLNGSPEGPPVKNHFPLIDRITSLHATIGALAALRERDISGEGQQIDVSLADTGFSANEIPITAYLADGTVQEKEGNGQGLTNAYETADGWALIHATSEAIWPRVCAALDRPEWLHDTRFAERTSRDSNVAAIETVLSEWFAARTTKDAVDHLSNHSVPAAPINSVAQAAVEPHLTEREVLVEVPDPIAGKIHVSGKYIKFSRTPMVVGTTPTIGEHTNEVLGDILGYPTEYIEELKTQGVVVGSSR
ncbi:MAG: CoA transferase [SAR202 cluster bacterium]|nr:CoA transferase [SAR202 cluster bacterium]